MPRRRPGAQGWEGEEVAAAQAKLTKSLEDQDRAATGKLEDRRSRSSKNEKATEKRSEI